MGVGLIVEVPMVNVSVAVVGNAVAGSVADNCNNLAGGPVLCDRLWMGWVCCHWVVGARGVDTVEWPQYIHRRVGQTGNVW